MAYGLWMGKSWSYKFALMVVIVDGVKYVPYLVPVILFSQGQLEDLVMRLIVSTFFACVYWFYLRQPHVKKYLGL